MQRYIILALAFQRIPADAGSVLNPSTVTRSFYHSDGLETDLTRLRAICLHGDDELHSNYHVDAYQLIDPDSGLHYPGFGKVVGAQELLMKVMQEVMPDVEAFCKQNDWPFVGRSRWRVGKFPGVHCQVDDQLSISAEIKSGRFLQRLFRILYRNYGSQGDSDGHADYSEKKNDNSKFDQWTFQAINIGAGEASSDVSDPSSREDPLFLWAGNFARKVILVDADASRLDAAILQLHATFPDVEKDKVLVPLVASLTPYDIGPAGPYGSFLRQETQGNLAFAYSTASLFLINVVFNRRDLQGIIA